MSTWTQITPMALKIIGIYYLGAPRVSWREAVEQDFKLFRNSWSQWPVAFFAALCPLHRLRYTIIDRNPYENNQMTLGLRTNCLVVKSIVSEPRTSVYSVSISRAFTSQKFWPKINKKWSKFVAYGAEWFNVTLLCPCISFHSKQKYKKNFIIFKLLMVICLLFIMKSFVFCLISRKSKVYTLFFVKINYVKTRF